MACNSQQETYTHRADQRGGPKENKQQQQQQKKNQLLKRLPIVYAL
jgi:hypothetical protein